MPSTRAPVLFTPSSGGGRLKAESVLVAWKNTRDSRRALADALPFLMRAYKVTVIGVSGEDTSVAQAELNVVAKRLARHGVDVQTQVVAKAHDGIVQTLENAAKVGADMIVMGVYGRLWALPVSGVGPRRRHGGDARRLVALRAVQPLGQRGQAHRITKCPQALRTLWICCDDLSPKSANSLNAP